MAQYLSKSGFAASQGWSPSYVTKLLTSGRLVLAPDGKRVDVDATLSRIGKTADPAKAGVQKRHEQHRIQRDVYGSLNPGTSSSGGNDNDFHHNRAEKEKHLARLARIEADKAEAMTVDRQGVAAGNVPVVTDAAWLATPTERGKFTAGDGSTTFRLPDYNGKSAGSLGAVFMRGDGALSAGTDGVIQGDAIRNIVGEYADDVFRRASLESGAFFAGRQVTSTGAAGSTGAAYSFRFDASRVVPTAADNRPLNVTGCWVIRLFGAVVNPGAADAAQLATEVSRLWSDKVPFSAFQGGHSANDHLILPGGLILQWGAVPSAPAGGSQLLSYPIAFPGGVLAIVPCAGAGAAGSPGINAQGISNTQVRFWNTSTSTSTQLGSYIAIGF